ncbi:PIN domain-containing protein [Micromonospora sp. MED01]|uniref:PIN domain-containing protein n=1 Tax=Micromonospora alfalfae TaxID=2911212 RepID=UPI001EE85F11|nr:PIN domain-containing protein [Micromonospora alfalfae]MCG5466725.1 PIN domain-containing protein [Micromonospora alfalfae]
MLPEVFPVVVDANALRDDLLRVAAGKGRTLMLNAANSGVLRFCAPHVVEEVEEHLEEWSAQKRLEPDAVRAAWRGDVAPLLRCVQVPDGLTTAVEQWRLDILAQPSHVGDYCDPDDVPTAALAILLNAALLSRDRAPLRAVYGEQHDHLAHAQWLNELRAVGDLGPLGGLIGALNALLGVAAEGLFHGVFATARRVPWPWLVVGALATVGTIRYFVAPETRRRLQTVLGTGLSSVSAAVAEVLAHREEAKRQFATLLPVQPGWTEITEDRNPAATLTRACLHHLARSPQSDLSAKELTELLRRTDDVAAGEARVRAMLRSVAAFSEPCRGRFQVGGVVSAPGVG